MSSQISECPADEAAEAMFVAKALSHIDHESKAQKLLVTRLSQYIAMLRAMHLWYHGAHHAVRGTSFSGDHQNLYGEIYTAIEKEVDAAIEKAIGLTGDEGMSCPMHIVKNALTVMENYPSPAVVTSLAIAAIGLEMEKHYLEMVEHMFVELEEAGVLSLGLNDFLAASANDHEMHLYHLQQRVKTELQE